MNENHTIPVSEFSAPNEATLPELSSQDVCRILSAKVFRGFNICAALFAIAGIGTAFFALFYHSAPWTVLSGILCIAFKCGAMLSYQKLELARHISVEPGIIYWAHPTLLRLPLFRSFKINISSLTLHSRTGKSLEVSMSRAQMAGVVSWLRRNNSDVRFGDYDDVPQPSNGQKA